LIRAAKGLIAVIDDDSLVLRYLDTVLSLAGYRVLPFSSGEAALEAMDAVHVDVYLSDVCMPGMDGLELLEAIRRRDSEAPVILITGFPGFDMAVSAIKTGAYDFIVKPFKNEYLLHAIARGVNYRRLKNIEKNYRQELERMVVLRSAELADALGKLKSMSMETISRLTSAAELRDEDTGKHIARIGLYAELLAGELGMNSDFVETIRVASAMHDVGKIGIPDAILRKREGLTAEEFGVMQQHTIIGERFLRGSPFPMLQMAASIARNHHERWDGSGYPHGLRGEEIPLEARIVMLVDQYDALRCKRVYKQAFSHQEACQIISKGDGRTMPGHFDLRVLNAFRLRSEAFEEIFSDNSD
jgi:putative two-component system response regulator